MSSDDFLYFLLLLALPFSSGVLSYVVVQGLRSREDRRGVQRPRPKQRGIQVISSSDLKKVGSDSDILPIVVDSTSTADETNEKVPLVYAVESEEVLEPIRIREFTVVTVYNAECHNARCGFRWKLRHWKPRKPQGGLCGFACPLCREYGVTATPCYRVKNPPEEFLPGDDID